MTVIEFSNKAGKHIPRILQYSNDAHLYGDGLPTNYQNRILFQAEKKGYFCILSF